LFPVVNFLITLTTHSAGINNIYTCAMYFVFLYILIYLLWTSFTHGTRELKNNVNPHTGNGG